MTLEGRRHTEVMVRMMGSCMLKPLKITEVMHVVQLACWNSLEHAQRRMLPGVEQLGVLADDVAAGWTEKKDYTMPGPGTGLYAAMHARPLPPPQGAAGIWAVGVAGVHQGWTIKCCRREHSRQR